MLAGATERCPVGTSGAPRCASVSIAGFSKEAFRPDACGERNRRSTVNRETGQRAVQASGRRIRSESGYAASARGTSPRRRPRTPRRRFAVCVDNSSYETSLERNKIYVVLPDKTAERDGDLRVIDESGEDYVFSAERFVAIELPAAVKASLSRALQ